MKSFILFALVASVSSFSVTIDKGLIGRVAQNWGSNAQDLMRWSQAEDKKTMEKAAPFLKAMDKELREVVKISQEANMNWAVKAN